MLASVVSSSGRGRALTLSGVDPETCMIVFQNHWTQVVRILEKHDGQRLGPVPGDEASAVQNYVEHMLFLLMEEERGQGGAMGPILELVVVENVMEKLFLWSLRRQFTDDMKLEQLRMYEMLVARAKQPLLHHKPVLKPLTMLLAACSSSAPPVEAELVSLLHQLCRVLVREASVLEMFFHSSEDQGAANFLLFSLLIPFIHRDGAVGSQARDALALIMSLSAENVLVARHIAENTFFCPVLATGLSGLYSGLPAKLEVYSEGWFCLEQQDWMQVPPLFQFLNSLDFCSTVCKVSHVSIRDQLLRYIYNGFLVPVMAPALHKLTLEEVMTTTAYLELFLRSISHPALLQTFLVFILRHRHDNVSILDTLVSRINTPFQLGTVSLALFRTLIGLYCEDVMLQLILRYLIPCSHLVCGARERLRERDCYSITASSLLSLTPSFFTPKRSSSPAPPPKPDYILWSKVTDGLLKGSLGMDELFSGSVGDSVGCSRVSLSEPLMDRNYLLYLYDARRVVCSSARACGAWSAPYDGLTPPPQQHQEEQEEESPAHQQEEESPAHQPPAPPEERLVTPPELEWDDSYDAAPEEGVAERPVPAEPPQHLQEMRKSAIMLVRGSYIEETDFQDDVLVYNLIARDETPSRRPYANEGHDLLSRPPSQPRDSALDPPPETGEEHQAGRLDHNRNLTGQSGGDDFISQCRQLIGCLSGEEDSPMDEEEHLLRIQALLHREEEDVDLSSFCRDEDDDDDDGGLGEELSGGRKHSIPFTGPFISVLLSRLENMLENSIEVNLLLTGIIVQLAAFPQPLIRGFLLNSRPVFHTSVRSLYQVLVSVRGQIEQFAAVRPEFPEVVREAAQFLLLKDQALREQESEAPQEGVAGWMLNGHVPGHPRTPRPPCPRIPPHLRNRVFATFLFAEFLKELAAVSQEHAILPELPEEGPCHFL